MDQPQRCNMSSTNKTLCFPQWKSRLGLTKSATEGSTCRGLRDFERLSPKNHAVVTLHRSEMKQRSGMIIRVGQKTGLHPPRTIHGSSTVNVSQNASRRGEVRTLILPWRTRAVPAPYRARTWPAPLAAPGNRGTLLTSRIGSIRKLAIPPDSVQS